MLRKYCDRCLAEIGVVSETMSISNNNMTEYFDLCKKCHEEMWGFFLKKKEEYMAEPDVEHQPCPPPPSGLRHAIQRHDNQYVKEVSDVLYKLAKEKADEWETSSESSSEED